MVDPDQPPAIGSEVNPIANRTAANISRIHYLRIRTPTNASHLQQPVGRATALSALRCYRILLQLSRAPDLNRLAMERLSEVVKNMPAPLSQQQIDRLPLAAITAETVQTNPVCAICLDDFAELEMVKQLPCKVRCCVFGFCFCFVIIEVRKNCRGRGLRFLECVMDVVHWKGQPPFIIMNQSLCICEICWEGLDFWSSSIFNHKLPKQTMCDLHITFLSIGRPKWTFHAQGVSMKTDHFWLLQQF